MSLGVAQFSPEVFSLFFLSVLSVYFLAVGKTLDSSLHPFQELRPEPGVVPRLPSASRSSTHVTSAPICTVQHRPVSWSLAQLFRTAHHILSALVLGGMHVSRGPIPTQSWAQALAWLCIALY